jgi:hypothetical protein
MYSSPPCLSDGLPCQWQEGEDVCPCLEEAHETTRHIQDVPTGDLL